LQPLVEDNLTGDIDKKIAFLDHLVNGIAFVKEVNDLDEYTFKKFRNDIYFEFIIIIGKFYVKELYIWIKEDEGKTT